MSNPRKGVAAPGYTQIPNEILDSMHLMKEAELRITLAICRKTFGWHKRKDKLSHSQLKELTGLSKQGVQNGLDDALKRGFIDREPASRQQFFYFLAVNVVDQSNSEPVNVVDQTGQRSRPQPVNVVDTQKKDLKKEKKNGGGPESVAVAVNPQATNGTAAAFTDSERRNGQRPDPAAIAADTLKSDRQGERRGNKHEREILAALEKMNGQIRAMKNPAFEPITGIEGVARKLAARGETVAIMRVAWKTCQANALKPMGAFMKWINDGWLPPPQPGHETRENPETKEVEAWTDGGGWVGTGRYAE